MKILYIYTQFKRPYRGFSSLSLNLSTDRYFKYIETAPERSMKSGGKTDPTEECRLECTQLEHPIHSGFWGERIYNVITFVGDNGAGKTTILHYMMDLFQQLYNGYYEGDDRGLLVLEDAGKDYILEYGHSQFPLKQLPAGYIRITLQEMCKSFWETKIIYIANALTQSDMTLLQQQLERKRRQQEPHIHIRHEFLYNCSTSSLMVEDCENESMMSHQSVTEVLECFFLYEQYKQVKFVFDKRQYQILKELKRDGHPVPVPKVLFIKLLRVDYCDIFGHFFENASDFSDEQNLVLFGLCSSCVENYLKTEIHYEQTDDLYVDRELVRKKARSCAVLDGSYDDIKAVFLKVLQFIHDTSLVIKEFQRTNSKENAKHPLEMLYQNCVEFINFVFDHRKQLKYFELPPKQKYEGETRQTIAFSIQTTGEAAEWFVKFLQMYRYTCEPYYYLQFHWGLSSGEQNLLRLFSSLYYIFHADYGNRHDAKYEIYNLKYDKSITCQSMLLCLDEADLTYHPEWQRCFLSILTAFLPKIYPASCFKNMQIFLTTHSPLMLGDSPSQSVIYLSKDEKGNTVVDDSGTRQTYGENLYKLLQNSFRVRDGAIGEMVRKKIDDFIKVHSEISENKLTKRGNKEFPDTRGYQRYLRDFKENVVALLADGIIKAKLEIEINRQLQLLEGCRPTCGQEIATEVRGWSTKHLEQQLKVLTDELERRKGGAP